MALTHDQKSGLDAAANLPAMVFGHVEDQRAQTILRKKDRGIWKSVTWGELGTSVRHVGMGLKAIGFSAGEVACILADTSPTWAMTDLGILGAGGLSAGLYTTSDADQLRAQLRDCACRILFVGNEEQLDKVLHIRDDCPRLERIVIFDAKGLRDFKDPMCEAFSAFVARGRDWSAAHLGDWEAGIAAIAPDDGAVLAYTSGATGAPKGIVLSHRSILFQISNSAGLFGQQAGDERLAFLPMPHFMERILGFYQSLYSGTISNYVENAETIRENLQEVRPTVMFAPPRVWEQTYFRVNAAANEATWLQRSLLQWAMAANRRVSDARRNGGAASVLDRLSAAAGSLLVLRKIRQMIGLDRLRVGGIGGAPVSSALVAWYGALGIELSEFYGLSESSGLAFVQRSGSAPKADRLAAYGEMKLSPAGEILVRGEHVFSGYWRDGAHVPRGDAADWFATGDKARIEGRMLRLSGRASDVITTQSGAEVTPADVETELAFSPYIADALVVGGDRNPLGCLVLLNYDNVEKWAHTQKIVFAGASQLARTQAVNDLIAAEIARLNPRLPEPIHAFRLIERRLEPEDPELTPMMKLRRHFVSEKYRTLIESMY